MNSAASWPACCASRRHRQLVIFFWPRPYPRFLAQYPEILFDLSFNEALTDIVAERFDAGIRIGERIERDSDEARALATNCRFCRHRRLISRNAVWFKSPDDQLAHDCIRIRFAIKRHLCAQKRKLNKGRDFIVHVKGRLVVNSVTVACRAAVEVLGLKARAAQLHRNDLAEGRPGTASTTEVPTPATGFFLYYPSRHQMRPAPEALVDFLRDERLGASRGASQ